MDIEFLGSFAAGSLPKQVYPEIAVGGRSNVGKSSFINSVLGRRSIARVSSRPGKTRTLNFYFCDKRFVLVDLPGYGYAHAPKREKKRWAKDVEVYLTQRKNLKAVILLADIRHFPLASDLDAMDWLSTSGKPFAIVLTKADKLGLSERRQRGHDITGLLAAKGIQSIVFSANTGLGRKEVWNWMEEVLRR